MDIKTLSATLGHESVSTALNVYTHVNDSMREQAAAKIDRRVARGGDCDGGQLETGTDTTDPAKSAEPPAFAPYKGKIRRRGTGCVSRIGDSVWEGRYSPRNPDGTRDKQHCSALCMGIDPIFPPSSQYHTDQGQALCASSRSL